MCECDLLGVWGGGEGDLGVWDYLTKNLSYPKHIAIKGPNLESVTADRPFLLTCTCRHKRSTR